MTDDHGNEHSHENGEDLEPRKNQIARRGFDGVSLASENAATQALIAKATADSQSRWVMAVKRPRSLADVRQDLLVECKRPSFAKVAMYAVPRGGKMITGLSIRFAEVAARCMTNISVESMTLYDSDEERMIRVSVVDYEANVTWSRDITVKKTVERRQLARGQRPIRQRSNSFGDVVYVVDASNDDLRMMEGAEISRAARTGILRIIPGHLLDECRGLVQQIAQDAAAKDPDGERNMIFDAFARLDVTPADLAEWLGHPSDKMTPAEVFDLRALYNALSSGELPSWKDATAATAAIRERGKAAADTARAAKAEKSPGPASDQKSPADATAPTSTATPAPKREASAGKGTSSTKDKIKEAKAQGEQRVGETRGASPSGGVPVEKPPAPSDAKPQVAAAQVKPDADPVQAAKTGYEERACTMCGVAIEVPIGDPPGGVCYACSQA